MAREHNNRTVWWSGSVLYRGVQGVATGKWKEMQCVLIEDDVLAMDLWVTVTKILSSSVWVKCDCVPGSNDVDEVGWKEGGRREQGSCHGSGASCV
jgi:hypothetical protein